jgi:hypothetical protein
MSYYLKDGELLWPTNAAAVDIRDSLPVGTYTVGAHPSKGFYLKPITEFNISGKVYGNTGDRAERIMTTFHSRPNATGVLLNGEKGSGKTMLAKLISQKAAGQGISTLVINTPFCGDSFNTFIQSINEPCVIVFDEFEKVFDEKEQEATLTLLDGVYPTKKLFVLTVNDKYRVNQHMRNRPGRIFYMIDYKGLDADFIREYCQDTLINKDHIEQIVRLTMMFDSFNFDMLKALVEEMNRYNETPNQALEMLNAKPFDAGKIRHTISVFMDGKELAAEFVTPSAIRGNPVAHDSVNVYIDTAPEDDDAVSTDLEVTPEQLRKIDPEAGTFTYVFNEGKSNAAVVVFTRDDPAKRQPVYNWTDAF